MWVFNTTPSSLCDTPPNRGEKLITLFLLPARGAAEGWGAVKQNTFYSLII